MFNRWKSAHPATPSATPEIEVVEETEVEEHELFPILGWLNRSRRIAKFGLTAAVLWLIVLTIVQATLSCVLPLGNPVIPAVAVIWIGFTALVIFTQGGIVLDSVLLARILGIDDELTGKIGKFTAKYFMTAVLISLLFWGFPGGKGITWTVFLVIIGLLLTDNRWLKGLFIAILVIAALYSYSSYLHRHRVAQQARGYITTVWHDFVPPSKEVKKVKVINVPAPITKIREKDRGIAILVNSAPQIVETVDVTVSTKDGWVQARDLAPGEFITIEQSSAERIQFTTTDHMSTIMDPFSPAWGKGFVPEETVNPQHFLGRGANCKVGALVIKINGQCHAYVPGEVYNGTGGVWLGINTDQTYPEATSGEFHPRLNYWR